ncbi:E3 ubiquitin-protein ligase TRIM39-like [Hyperolius riggenbachi]|uniref:E3 ubiquitin-protein ligase TRIM39-like n=1 Tax=Hyperolius riggenbachi TaxID=752182 RepID=UPI0035A27AB1
MASASLGEELSCSICLSLYTEPVTLTCGHNFCRNCIVTALETQEESGRMYSCPECRAEYPNHPLLKKNRNLSNIVDNFAATQQNKPKVLCTFCVDGPVSAVKTCQQCETSMCDKHLAAHNETVDHVLVEPTFSFRHKKCSIHKKLLEYYCSKDSTFLCVSCCLVGTHKGHLVELLEEASEKKKEGLRRLLKKMAPKRGINERIQSLQEKKGKVQEKAADEKKRATALFEDIRRQLEVHEMKVLNEITGQEERLSQSVSDCIQQLDTRGGELSRKMARIEKMCNMTDPIAVLQDPESETADQDMEEVSVPDMNFFRTFHVVQESIKELITQISLQTNSSFPKNTDLLLDAITAHNLLDLSDDFRTASVSDMEHDRPHSLERFITYPQVLSFESFSSGRHYWEVEVSDDGDWDVGVSYPSIEREGDESGLGDNNKSWSFRRSEDKLSASHNSQITSINPRAACRRLRIYLDYEAGCLSFYQLCDRICLLHTFNATFTEPLHAAFFLDDKAWVKVISP